MDDIFFFEDDYCNIELLPQENLDFCNNQIKNIQQFSKNCTDSMGFSDAYRRGVEPISLATNKISEDSLKRCFHGIIPRYDRVMSGYSYFSKPCSNVYAYGTNQNVVLFYETEEAIVTKIWFALDIKNGDDCKTAKLILSKLKSLGNFILVDWGLCFAEQLNNVDKLTQYINKRLLSFTSQ